MALLNHVTREITAKVVYYGPGLCGKTSNLTFIYDNLDDEGRGHMLSLATESDRTLFFDFLPMDIGEIRGFKARVQLYTVPGQVYYEETRKRVLKGSDGVVFVADSQRQMQDANRESLAQLRQHLAANGLNIDEIPLVLQYNKRDLGELLTVDELDQDLNPGNAPFFEAVANEGIGVEDTLKAIIRLVLKNLMNKGIIRSGEEPETATAQARPSGVPPGFVLAADPAEVPAPFTEDQATQELMAAAGTDPFAEAEPTPFTGTSEPVVALPVRQDPEWLFADPGEETASLLRQEAHLEDVVAVDPAPGKALEKEDPLETLAEVAPLDLEEVPFDQKEEPTPATIPTIHLSPGQPYEADLVIEGRSFRLKIVLEPLN